MSSYDPFSYGQIKLGGDQKRQAETPDDILFQDAGPGPSTATKAGGGNSDWELLDDASASPPSMRGDALQTAMDFGADVLGETAPAPQPRPQPQRPAPATRVAPMEPAPAPARGAPTAHSQRPSAPQERIQPTPRPRPKSAARTVPVRPSSMSSRMLATLLPSVLIACGGSLTAWLYAMEHNPIMAGIVGVTSLVGAAFLRVLFRG